MKKATVVLGLGFGDEGKGSIVDFLVREQKADLVVRFGGGPQCAHNVVEEDGRHHTFAQFGSGTLAGARTFLSRYMLIDPLTLIWESRFLEGKGVVWPTRLLTADPRCSIITPWHRLANRMREMARGAGRHGSVGLGIGEARADEIDGNGLQLAAFMPDGLALEHLRHIKERKIAEMEPLSEAAPGYLDEMKELHPEKLLQQYLSAFSEIRVNLWEHENWDSAVFEGHQGVLLDEQFGFAPHNTWSDCTFKNADAMLAAVECPDITRIGVLRSYFTRHGAGPFPTEDSSVAVPEPHNNRHPWMGCFRAGHFDAYLAGYAIDCCVANGTVIDSLAITHMDSWPSARIATSYSDRNFDFQWLRSPKAAPELFHTKPLYETAKDREDFIGGIESDLDLPVSIQSFGPYAKDKRWAMSEVSEFSMVPK